MRLEELGPVGPNGSAEAELPLSGHRNFQELAGRPNLNKPYSTSTSINRFLCFAGSFRLSGMTRVTAGAMPEFRAARRASVPLSKTFFRFFILALGRKFSGIRN